MGLNGAFSRKGKFSNILADSIRAGRRACLAMLLEKLDGHERCMINYDPSHVLIQQLDYLAFTDIYRERIGAFHV
ncbi:MAG: hypothetical protein OXC26_18225 [Albidovulum sp.]|nr:hypothetical protein [Albidovulum sp.]